MLKLEIKFLYNLGLVIYCVIVASKTLANETIEANTSGLQVAQNYSNSDSRRNSAETYGPVRKNQSLWSIARRFRPAYTTMSQVVYAIYQRNPNAFDSNNINRLRSGSMLSIPSVDEMRAIDHKTAYAAINPESKQRKNPVVEKTEESPNTTSKKSRVAAANPLVIKKATVELTPQPVEVEPQQQQATELAAVSKKPARPATKARRPLFRYSYDISVADDDNIRRAQEAVDIRSDTITSITLNARGGRPLDKLSLLSYGGSLSYEAFDEFDELNNFNFNGNIKYRFSASAGFTAPVYTLGARLGGIDSESDMRDSTLLSISFELNKWLTTAISMTTGLSVNQRESKSEAFDTSDAKAFINFDLNLSKAVLIYGTYSYISGDIVSSATPSLKIINASEVIEPDDAFGGIATNQFVYRLDAESQVFTLGYNQILNPSLSLDLSFRYIDSEVTDNIYYERNILRASLLGRF